MILKRNVDRSGTMCVDLMRTYFIMQQAMPLLAFSFALQCTFVDVLKKVNWTKSMKTIYLGILVSEIINDLFLRPWVSIVHGVMTRQC